MGSWWSVEVGSREVPIWGKNYVPDALMLVFTDENLTVRRSSIEALEQADSDDQESDWRLPDGEDLARSRLFHYTATAGTLRTRLELQGFSTNWVRKLSNAFFEDRYEDDPFEYWPAGAQLYPTADSVTNALTSRRGLAAVSALHDRHPGSEIGFLKGCWEELREAFDDPRFAFHSRWRELERQPPSRLT